MISRSIGKLVRGRCTPFQVVVASILGACLGFLPGLAEAPGSVVFLAALLAVLNANLFVAGVVGAAASLLSLALVPTTFAVGRFLLDGPTSGLFGWAVNAPVLATFGLERYVTTGGLALGVAFGAVVGVLLARLQARVRSLLAKAESDSERFQRLQSKGWVRVAAFVFVGRRPKDGYESLGERRVGNPVRLVGVVGVVALTGLAYAGNAFLGSAYLQNALQGGLERANGATVDLAALDLDPLGGRVSLEGLAVADADELTRDLFRGLTFEADVSTEELLRKRLVVERLVVRSASSGEERSVPGERVGEGAGPPEGDAAAGSVGDGERSLEEVLADVELWRERLERARRLLARFAGEDTTPDASEGADGAREEGLRERLERQARQWGHGEVVATHLLRRGPRVVVNSVVVDDFQLADVPGERFELRIENLSSAPALLDAGPRVSLRSKDGDVTLELALGALGSGATAAAPNAREARLAFALKGVPVDSVAGDVVVGGSRVVRGGTLDVELDGAYRDGGIDLPLRVSLHDTTLTIPGYAPTAVDRFALPIGVRGPLDAPAFSVDDDALVDALVQAGQRELARRVQAEVDARLAEARAEIEGRLQEELDARLGDALGEGLDGVAERGLDELGGDALDAAKEGLLGGAGSTQEKAADLVGGLFGRKQD